MKYPPLLLSAAVSGLLFPATASAAPYASALTESGTDVSFMLNEAADSVKVVFNDPLPPLDLGTIAAGAHTFSKGAATSYRIEVGKNAGPGWKSGVIQQISSDTSSLVKFANGMGIAVNRKPDTGRLFGRVYVSTGSAGTAAPVTTPASPSRATGDGLFVLNPDLTGTSLGTDAISAGINWGTSTASPFRLTVGDKGDVFVADWSDTNGSVFKSDGDLAGMKNILGGPTGAPGPSLSEEALHGSIAAVVTEGSETGNNLRLWVVDEDLQLDKTSTTLSQVNGLWAWDSFATPLPIETPPTLLSTIGINFATQYADLAQGPDGTFYKTQRRSSGNESAVYALSPDGTPLDSAPVPENPEDPPVNAIGSRPAFQAWTGVTDAADPFLETRACDVSADGWMALLRNDNAVSLIKVANGVFDWSSLILLYTKPTTVIGRDISFDAAGNLYTLSSGQALLRVFAPGGNTLATTTSAGAFSIVEITPPVPAEPVQLPPGVTAMTRAGADLTLTVSSRLGLNSTHTVQKSADLGNESAWITMAAAEYTVTGDPPTFTVKIPGAFNAGERIFYRVRRR